MHSKLQFDSKWRLGEGLITQLVSKWELNYTVSGTVGLKSSHYSLVTHDFCQATLSKFQNFFLGVSVFNVILGVNVISYVIATSKLL